MDQREPLPKIRPEREDDDHDLIDAIPGAARATSQFERSFGPSCLLSMIIVLLLVIVFKRFLQLSWIGIGLLTLVVWFGVLLLLVRWRPDEVIDAD